MPKAIIVYESRKGRTEALARRIEEGMKESGVEVVMKRAGSAKANDLRDVNAVVLGSPTYNGDLMGTVKTVLFEMEKANLKGKVGATFGSYGWSGEAVQRMSDTMKHVFKMNVEEPGLKVLEGQEDLGEAKSFAQIHEHGDL